MWILSPQKQSDSRTLMPIDSISSGRFHINELQLVDTMTGKVYPFPEGESLTDLMLTDVEGLVSDTEKVNAMMLFALSRYPMSRIADATLLDDDNGIEIVSYSYNAALAGDFSWRFSKPIYHNIQSTYAHVCGASNLIIKDDGTIRTLSPNTEVTVTANQNCEVRFTTDHLEPMELEWPAAKLVAYAFTPITRDNFDRIPLALDGDPCNFAVSNLVFDMEVRTDSVIQRDENDAVHFKTK